VFDFSRGEMTQAKIKELKNSLNKCARTHARTHHASHITRIVLR
jgi:hypothetical protein